MEKRASSSTETLEPQLAKRQKTQDDEETKETPAPNKTVLDAVIEGDLGPALGIKPGDRLQVQWFLEEEEEKDGEGTKTSEKETWWGCTLIGSTGKKHKISDSDEKSSDEYPIAIYQVKYDALPPAFPSETISDVCFMNEKNLLDIEYDGLMLWRKEGASDSDAVSSHPQILAAMRKFEKDHDIGKLQKMLLESKCLDDDIIPVPNGETREASEQLVNTILANVLQTHFQSLRLLPATTQYKMADKVALVKNMLVEKITNCLDTKKILDTDSVKDIVKEVLSSL